MITAREFLNLVAILNSIDEVPGMPVNTDLHPATHPAQRQVKGDMFRADPLRFLRRADDATQAAIWAEVTRRLGRDALEPVVLAAAE